jgi:hypothetical protein
MIQLAAHKPRMESTLDIRSVLSFAKLTVNTNLISAHNTFNITFYDITIQFEHSPTLVLHLM